MRPNLMETKFHVLVCLVILSLVAGNALACPQPTQWTIVVEKNCKKKVEDVEKQFERVREADDQLKYNPEDVDAQRNAALERLRLNELIGDGFRKDIADARLRNDKVAVRNLKKYRSKLMAIKEQLGNPPANEELVGRDMNKKEVLAADLMIKDLHFNIVDAADKANRTYEQDESDVAKQKEAFEGLNAAIAKAQEVEEHFQNLANEAYDEGQTKLASSFQDYANQANKQKQVAIDVSNFAGLAKMLTN